MKQTFFFFGGGGFIPLHVRCSTKIHKCRHHNLLSVRVELRHSEEAVPNHDAEIEIRQLAVQGVGPEHFAIGVDSVALKDAPNCSVDKSSTENGMGQVLGYLDRDLHRGVVGDAFAVLCAKAVCALRHSSNVQLGSSTPLRA